MFGNAKVAHFVLTTDFASVAAASSPEQSVAVPAALNVVQGCVAYIVPRAAITIGIAPSRCTANAILVKFVNPTAGAVDLASQDYDVFILYPAGQDASAVTV